MASFIRPDSAFYQAWSAAADLVVVNLLTLTACLPVLTAGAPLTACARVTGDMARGQDGGVAASWWRTFRAELGRSLGWWVPTAGLLALALWERLVLGRAGQGALSGLVLVGVLLLVAVLVWLVPLTAFFDAPLGRHLANAARLAVGALGLTAASLGVLAAPLLLAWLVPGSWAALAWFTVLLGVAFQAYLIALLQRRTMSRLRERAARA